jgi:hypothetical protein
VAAFVKSFRESLEAIAKKRLALPLALVAAPAFVR